MQENARRKNGAKNRKGLILLQIISYVNHQGIKQPSSIRVISLKFNHITSYFGKGDSSGVG
jgi:hypothetical protein